MDIYWVTMGYLCSWAVEELREVIVLHQQPEFNPADSEMLAVPKYNNIRHCCRSFRDTLRTQHRVSSSRAV